MGLGRIQKPFPRPSSPAATYRAHMTALPARVHRARSRGGIARYDCWLSLTRGALFSNHVFGSVSVLAFGMAASGGVALLWRVDVRLLFRHGDPCGAGVFVSLWVAATAKVQTLREREAVCIVRRVGWDFYGRGSRGVWSFVDVLEETSLVVEDSGLLLCQIFYML